MEPQESNEPIGTLPDGPGSQEQTITAQRAYFEEQSNLKSAEIIRLTNEYEAKISELRTTILNLDNQVTGLVQNNLDLSSRVDELKSELMLKPKPASPIQTASLREVLENLADDKNRPEQDRAYLRRVINGIES